MELRNIKGKYIICFSQTELSAMLELHGRKQIEEERVRQGFSLQDMLVDANAVSVVDAMTKRNANDRDYHEVFASFFVLRDFYDKESQICFELMRGFDPKKHQINSLDDLNKLREGTLTDFIFKTGNDLREFQLKRYRKGLNLEELSTEIKQKVQHYGNNLGDMNLLLLLQSKDSILNTELFESLHVELARMNWSFSGQIMILYNENGDTAVINQVYPELTTSRVPARLPSSQLAR